MAAKKKQIPVITLTPEEADLIQLIYDQPHILGNLAGKDKLTALHSEWIKYIWNSDKHRSLQAHRGSYKSTAIGAVGVVYWLLFHPDDRVAIVRKTFTDAADTVSTIAKIISDPKIRELFKLVQGEYPEFVTRRKEKIEFSFKKTKTNEGSVEAFGLDAAFTGRHFDRMLLDDVITLKDRQSRAERIRTKDIIREIQTNIIDPGKPVSFIGTPWHSEDAWEICPKPKKYSINDCSILSEAEIAEKKKLTTPSLFAANYLLEHVPDEGALFSNPVWEPWQTHGIEKVYAHIDAAYDGDHYCALTIMARRWDGKLQAVGFSYPGNIKTWAPDAVDIMRRYKVKKLFNETNPDKGYTADMFRALGMLVEEYDENMNKHAKIATYLFEAWPDLVWDEQTDGDYMSMVTDYMEGQTPDDACLVGDSLIPTRRGVRYIKDIDEGDEVLTPFGFKKVLFAGCTGQRTVICKQGLCGTSDHKVFDKGVGLFVPLSDATFMSKLTVKEMLQWERARELNSMGKSMNEQGRASIISAFSLVRSVKEPSNFTGQYGNSTVGRKYQKATTYIIKILMLTIMISLIWSAWKVKSIYRYMQRRILRARDTGINLFLHWIKQDRRQVFGTGVLRVLSGTAHMLKNLLLRHGCSERLESALIVERNTRPATQNNSIVAKNAEIEKERDLVSDTNVLVPNAGQYSHQNYKKQNTVPLVVKAHIDIEEVKVPVYNLTVADVGCFYADGVLVSNCDSAASLVRTKFSKRSAARSARYEW